MSEMMSWWRARGERRVVAVVSAVGGVGQQRYVNGGARGNSVVCRRYAPSPARVSVVLSGV